MPSIYGTVLAIICIYSKNLNHHLGEYQVRIKGDQRKKDETNYTKGVPTRDKKDFDEKLLIILLCQHLSNLKKYEDNSILLNTDRTVGVTLQPMQLKINHYKEEER